MEKEPIFVDARELFNPKLFEQGKAHHGDVELPDPAQLLLGGKLTLTVQEMAEQLNISTALAYELTERAGFPVVSITERRKVIPVEGLVNWLREQSRGGD